RTVEGHVIVSARDPRVRIELPETVRYVGADRWILYGMADCELHAFVDADAEKRVQRLYWVQFEGYVASRPELHHTYDSPRHATLGGMDFYLDTWITGKGDTVAKGSDLEHILALVRSRGYTMPADMLSVRLVHLFDRQKRKELMIIYSEDLAMTGLAAGQLREAGSAGVRWSAIERDLIARGLERVKLAQLRPQKMKGVGLLGKTVTQGKKGRNAVSIYSTEPRGMDGSHGSVNGWRALHQGENVRVQESSVTKKVAMAKATAGNERARALISGFHGIRYQVKDVERAIGFYTNHLGFT